MLLLKIRFHRSIAFPNKLLRLLHQRSISYALLTYCHNDS